MGRRHVISVALVLAAGCASPGEKSVGHEGASAPWLAPPAGTSRDPGLEEAAALLCARDTNAVLDDDARRAGRIWEGQVAAALERGAEEAEVLRRLSQKADALVAETGATHAGLARGVTPEGVPCAAVVLTRRKLERKSALPGQLERKEPFPLSLSLTDGMRDARVFLLSPTGTVERSEHAGTEVATVIDPRHGSGRYVLEVIASDARDAPEVVLLWPFTVGQSRLPPSPAVLFPDEGHSDVALTRRLEALVQRLRVEQQIPSLLIASPLSRLASSRALALAESGRLGHRLPDDKSALEALRQAEPGFPVKELAEVQAQAGTLEEAWMALLDSPAHRYEIVGTRASHIGAHVVRGQDGLGRPLVTVVMLLARRINVRPVEEVRTELIGRLNLARDVVSSPPLKRDKALERVATELAAAMARAGALDEAALGAPVSELALDAHGGLEEARVVIAHVDDPLRLAPSGATLDAGASVIGIGLVSPEVAGQWYVALVVGTPR